MSKYLKELSKCRNFNAALSILHTFFGLNLGNTFCFKWKTPFCHQLCIVFIQGASVGPSQLRTNFVLPCNHTSYRGLFNKDSTLTDMMNHFTLTNVITPVRILMDTVFEKIKLLIFLPFGFGIVLKRTINRSLLSYLET